MAKIHKEKFADLIREHKISMYRLAFGILCNKEDAEDAVSEAIIKAYEHLDSLRDEDKFRQWIMQIVANEARKSYGKKKRVELAKDMEIYETAHYDEHDELWGIVLTLEEKYRAVIVLYYYNQMKIKEISKILHITEGTVKSRLSRAKGQLKNMLN